jgi:acyl-CoA reductase-like NAD-dependent aldehyde dehydrogenase
LELWGNDAFVLLDHTDTDAMAAAAVACRISNWGQRCNSSKRFIVLEKHYDVFVQAMKTHMEGMQRGDPMDVSTQLPPISSTRLLNDIHDQVQRTLAQWATLITGGEILGEKKQFYSGTVLADVTPDMVSYQEEVFWPVASIIKAHDIEHAIVLANNSDFWLSATVWWDDSEQCKSVADRLEWGMIFINNPAGSKASLPFWWVKKSGYGKENGPEGLRAFTNKKAIVYSVE